MKILFCKIAHMKYYKGVKEYDDKPYNGGSFVHENGYGYEEYNFKTFNVDGTKKCLGFVEPKSTNGSRNNLHIEKIEGCESCKNDDFVEDVLVVWCATADTNECVIVGWYKNATVFRQLQYDKENDRDYNVIADAADCVLLPNDGTRRMLKWRAASVKYKKTYGFGQSLVWYPIQKEAENYISALLGNIENFDGKNWLDYHG